MDFGRLPLANRDSIFALEYTYSASGLLRGQAFQSWRVRRDDESSRFGGAMPEWIDLRIQNDDWDSGRVEDVRRVV